METITYEDFKKLDIRIGKVIAAERVPETDKLIKCTVDFGSEEALGLGERTIVSGIAEFIEPEALVGGLYPYVVNLEPRMIKGVESQGMIMATGGKEGQPFSLLRAEGVEPGSRVS